MFRLIARIFGGGGPARKGASYEKTGQLLEQGMSVEQIARERGLATSTIAGHLERLIDRGMDIDLRPMLPAPRKFEEIRRVIGEMGGSPLPPVKERLGYGYSYCEIKIVRAFLRQQGKLPY